MDNEKNDIHSSQTDTSRFVPGLSDTDLTVWARFRQGNQQAFDTLMTTHYRTLFRYGNRFSSDPEFIKDCIQDLFLYLWERRVSLNAEVSVKPYLLASLRRQMHRKMSGNVFTDSLPGETEPAFHFEFSVEEQYIREETAGQRAAQLRKLLGTLPARQKEVIYLRFFQNLSRDQIAGVMTITPQTVSNLLQLAFKQLRNCRGIELLLPFLWLFNSLH